MSRYALGPVPEPTNPTLLSVQSDSEADSDSDSSSDESSYSDSDATPVQGEVSHTDLEELYQVASATFANENAYFEELEM